MALAKRELSLLDLPERPEAPLLLTPRSRNACLSEGVELTDLRYRPLDEFADRQLSPRIAKLRYDYFEAKRKDLLVLAMAAREKLLQIKQSPGLSRLNASSNTLTSNSTAEPSDWGILNMEREKLSRFQQGEKKWLEKCLRHELELYGSWQPIING